jgi:hypothetical protein
MTLSSFSGEAEAPLVVAAQPLPKINTELYFAS